MMRRMALIASARHLGREERGAPLRGRQFLWQPAGLRIRMDWILLDNPLLDRQEVRLLALLCHNGLSVPLQVFWTRDVFPVLTSAISD